MPSIGSSHHRTTLSRTRHGTVRATANRRRRTDHRVPKGINPRATCAARQRAQTCHTFVFGLSDGRVIDGSRGGNSTRFLNHDCSPNYEAIEMGEQVFIHALAPSLLARSFPSTRFCRPMVRSATTFVSSTRVITAHRHVVEPCCVTVLNQRNRRSAEVQTIRRAMSTTSLRDTARAYM